MKRILYRHTYISDGKIKKINLVLLYIFINIYTCNFMHINIATIRSETKDRTNFV